MKVIFQPPVIIHLNILVISKIPTIFALSCLEVCKALQHTEVDLSPNRYLQLITSQLQSISQIDTEKFLIQNKDNHILYKNSEKIHFISAK